MPRPVSQAITQRPVVAWRLELLGQATLLQEGQILEPLEKRAAILLAYLALEGPTSRAKLAGLIWADSTEEAARANLRQRLKRLKNALGAELIVPEETLRLRPDLEVDAVELESLTFTGEYAKAMNLEGELLSNLEFEDHPELHEWLTATRQRLKAAQREALTSESERLESSDLGRALELANRILELDELSEEAHQRVMRLQYLRGDRSSALKTFERLKTKLERELGIAPLPQTLELVRTIERGETTPQHAPKAAHISLQRPPVLVGREHEWAQLEAAWAAGKMIFLSGEAGAGKTRLATDFLNAKGKVAFFEARPGDALVSYSTNARIHRKIISDYNTLNDMPEWVRLELSRILPELGTPPHPIQNEADKLRFYQAKTEACLLAIRTGINIMLLDDLQFIDNGTFESGIRTWSENLQNGLIKGIMTYREAELDPFIRESLQQAINAGQATQIKLSSLEQQEVQTMLETLGVDGLEKFGATMHQATGGNPMFVLETARTLVANGMLEHQDLSIPLPASVSAAIQARLNKLTAGALRIARVASVAGTDFNLNLAASVLETHVLDLSENLSELENAQVMKGLGFVHDLIAQTTLEGLPSSIRTLLHERIAVYLEKTEGNPARIAHHWIEAGQDLKAVPFLEKALLTATEQSQYRAASGFGTRAARILETANEPEKAWDFWSKVQDMVTEIDVHNEIETVIIALNRTASTPKQIVGSKIAESHMLTDKGDLFNAKQVALKAVEMALKSKDHYDMGLSELVLGQIYSRCGENSKAIHHYAKATSYYELELKNRIRDGENEVYITLIKNEIAGVICSNAVMLNNLGRLQEAEIQHKRAISMLRDLKKPAILASTLSNLSSTLIAQGRSQEASGHLIEAKQIEARLSDETFRSIASSCNLYDVQTNLCQYTDALCTAQVARKLGETLRHPFLSQVLARIAEVYVILGDVKNAEDLFKLSQQASQSNVIFINSIYRRYAHYLLTQRRDARDAVTQALGVISQEEQPYLWHKTHLDVSLHFSPEKRMQIAKEILMKSELAVMKGLHILAFIRGAQTQLEIKKPKKALEYSQQAMSLLEHYEPDFQRAEALLTHCQTLNANKHQDFKPFLKETLQWLLETANNHVPTEYRESFLSKNPYNAAILELAREAGLELA